MGTDTKTPDTIVLIHGLWLTSLSWEFWLDHYKNRGFNVVARGWAGMDGGNDALRNDTSEIDPLGVTEVADHYEAIIKELESPPIIMGHSFGGLITQVLL